MAFVAINPATGVRLAVFREHSRAHVERILTRATNAQREWRELTPARRAPALRALARELRLHSDALARLAVEEMGKPIAQGRGEIEKCAETCEFFARQAPSWLAPERADVATGHARVSFEPLGVILGIMPWNFPYWQTLRAAVPALASGNALLVKPAPNVPGCALALEKLFARAGFPAGLFASVFVATDRVPALIADPRIHGVTLTGSTAAGKAVAALAGAAMKPGVFELGGSDPLLVLDDADLDRAAEIGAHARLLNAGQSCICAKRFIVVRAVRAAFEARLVERMRSRKLGDPLDPATDIGPLARADLRDRVAAQVDRSVRRGARVLLGGEVPVGPGYFYPATVLTGVRPGMPAHDEEVFGPVAAVIAVRDEAEAIRVANASRYGLGAAIFSRRVARPRRVAAQLDAGCVFINDFVRSMPELPFGGIKESGYGRELGRWGLHAFVNVKSMVGG